LLSAHESEIERLEALKQQRAPILELVDRHKTLIKERDDLQASSQDASRLMLRGQKGEKRDPGKLLREEKMRKRITKELPKVEAEIKRGMEAWEEEYGRPFLVFGDRYLDEIESQAKVAPPPRSKTPSNMSHGRSNSKSSAAPSRAGTVKGASQTGLRSKTPTNFNTIRGNPLSQSTMHKSTASKGNISPSRIPSRAPLSSTTGNNSPDRKYMTIAGHKVDEPSRPVKNMGPPRLPPPKMKDLFVPPASATPTLLSRSTAELERSASIVRQIAPEDPYDDLNQRSAMSRSAYYHPSSTSHRSVASVASSSSSVENNPPSNNHHSSSSHYHNDRLYSHAPAPPSRPESRQISGTSNASSQAISAASGSENWETLDEGGSEMEADAIETYYAKLRAQQHHQALARAKRASPECGWAEGPGKRVRASPMLGATARGVVDGIDEAGWEDDDGY
jgi:protein regulator of cytokinesis 1